MRTMILYYNTNSYFFPYLRSSTIHCFKVYKKINKITSIIHEIPLVSALAYGEWIRYLKKYDKIIIFDNVFDKNLAKYLNKQFKGEIFVYSWNTAITSEQKNKLLSAKRYFPVYSFDREDCKKLGLKYASMVYSRDIVTSISEKESINEYDVIFLGWDKGRRKELFDLYCLLKKMSFKCYFLIRGFEKEKLHDDFRITNENTPYEEYLQLLNSSSVIIDIQQKGQEGLTIRMVEAIFFRKKIITNKQDINKYDFYNSNNIFILGKDCIDDLKDFIISPYKDIPYEIEKKYDLEYWVDEYFHK